MEALFVGPQEVVMQFEMFDADLIAFPLRRYARLTRFTADQLCATEFETGEKIWSEVVLSLIHI